MVGNEHGNDTPMELLRELVEKSGRWSEELVAFTRTIFIVFIILAFFFCYQYSRSVFSFLSEESSIVPVIVGIPIIALMIYAGWYTYHNYSTHLHRRDRWRRKYEILRKKEDEIERLLSEEAG